MLDRFWNILTHTGLCLFSFMLLLGGGCYKRIPLPHATSPEVIAVLKQLRNKTEHSNRLEGSFVLQSTGIRQFFAKAKVDLIAQAPSSLYVSTRSFFESPLQIATCNASQCCLWDSQDPTNIDKQCMPSEQQDLLLLPLPPALLVDMLLQRIPIENPVEVEQNLRKHHIRFIWVLKNDTTISIETNADDGRILHYQVETPTVKADVAYETNKWRVKGKYADTSFNLELVGENIQYQQKPYDNSVFELH